MKFDNVTGGHLGKYGLMLRDLFECQCRPLNQSTHTESPKPSWRKGLENAIVSNPSGQVDAGLFCLSRFPEPRCLTIAVLIGTTGRIGHIVLSD